MKRIMFLLLLLIYALSNQSQVRFEESLTWPEVLAKAKQENKYIFLDCYATWCVPCKEMDEKVYPDPKIGTTVNDRFIAVKMQMDSTAMDNSFIQSTYKYAKEIGEKYSVSAYPTYLFFSPEGKLVHKGSGTLPTEFFLSMVNDAASEDRQYYTRLERYISGKTTFAEMKELSGLAYYLRDDSIAEIIRKDYIENYLLKLPQDQLLTFDNLGFIIQRLSSSEEVFKIYYPNGQTVEKSVRGILNSLETTCSMDAMNGYRVLPRRVVVKVIQEEDINPLIIKNGDFKQPLVTEPDWLKMQKQISGKYSHEYTTMAILLTKIKWYREKKSHEKLADAFLEYSSKYAVYPDDRTLINETAWNDIFFNISNKKTLGRVASVMKKMIDELPSKKEDPYIDQPAVQYIDTYANLLHKSGRTSEAILYEKKALELQPNSVEFKSVLEKMQKGQPTWIVAK